MDCISHCDEPTIIKVRVGGGYPILIGNNILRDFPDNVHFNYTGSNRIIVVTDENIENAGHLDVLMETLGKRKNIGKPVVLTPGEQTKSFQGLDELIYALFEQGIDRSTMLIAFGGGVIGDLTGFAASIILRGIDFIQIPTTLLSQIDSSVGGKTGINNEYGKNLIGTFKQPKMVLIDPTLLNTLPDREMKSGYAELVKSALISIDSELWKLCNQHGEKILQRNPDVLLNAIPLAIKIKKELVELDEREENGNRALLNLGHTFGHALEKIGDYVEMTHGEGVSVGIVLAFALSVKMGLCSETVSNTVKEHLNRLGMPTKIDDVIHEKWKRSDLVEQLIHFMNYDKKMNKGLLTFILMKGIGTAIPYNRFNDVQNMKKLEEVLMEG